MKTLLVEIVSEEIWWASLSRQINYFFHWFIFHESSKSRQEVEYFRDREIRGWKWGWYNYAEIILIGILPLAYIIHHFYF